MATGEEQLRNALADSVSIVKKGQEKTIAKLDEIQAKKETASKEKETAKRASLQSLFKHIKDVENAIKNQKEVESISINNPEAITGDLKTGLEGIIKTLKDELKNFDKNIVVKNDFSNFASLFKSSQDKRSVIEALKKIENKLDKPEKEQIDYTLILDDIAKALEVKEELLPTLKAILEKETDISFPEIMDVNLNPRLIDDDRLRTVLPEEQVKAMSSMTTGMTRIATTDNQTNGTQKTQLVDSGGTNFDLNNPLQVQTRPLGIIDTNNSTDTLLVADEKFVGSATDISQYAAIGIRVYADVPSTTKGLKIYYSQDGTTNWRVGEEYTVNGGSAKFFTPTIQGQYCRVEYQNDGADQATFSIDVILKTTGMKWSSHNINDPITDEDDAELMKSVITGKRTDGDWDNVSLTNGNNLKMSLEEYETTFNSAPLPTRDFDLDVAIGRISGYKTIHKYGRHANVGATEVTITSSGVINWLTTATTVRIKAGGNVNDTAAGTGAREIIVQGLDQDFNEASEAITTAGASASSPTTITFIRVFRVYVSSVGTYTGVNAGNIVIENSAGGTDLIRIDADEGQTQFASYTIPAGKTGYISSIYSTVDASKNGSVKMWARNNADDTTAPYSAKRLKLFFDGLVGGNLFKPRIPVDGSVLTEKTDIWFTGVSDATGASMSVDFEILLVDN